MVSEPNTESDDSADSKDEPSMTHEVMVNKHNSVGPYPDKYGHGPLTLIGDELVVCLDCGYTVHDIRLFLHEECNREENPITQSWREWFIAEDASNLPTSDGD